jgi:hypothetical protein
LGRVADVRVVIFNDEPRMFDQARVYDRHGLLIGQMELAAMATDTKTRVELLGNADDDADLWLIETENCGC